MFHFKMLESLRKEKKMLTHEVTKMLKENHAYNISPTTLWRWENGRSSPQARDLKILAKFYGVNEEDFFRAGVRR